MPGPNELAENEPPAPLDPAKGGVSKGGEHTIFKGEELARELNRDRYKLAMALLGLVALVAVGSLALSYSLPQARFAQVREVIQTIFGPLVTLLGTSFAWYYASRNKLK